MDLGFEYFSVSRAVILRDRRAFYLKFGVKLTM